MSDDCRWHRKLMETPGVMAYGQHAVVALRAGDVTTLIGIYRDKSTADRLATRIGNRDEINVYTVSQFIPERVLYTGHTIICRCDTTIEGSKRDG